MNEEIRLRQAGIRYPLTRFPSGANRDTSPFSGLSAYGANSWGRVAYRQQNNCAGLTPSSTSTIGCLEVYSYTPSGKMSAEELTGWNLAYNSSWGPTLSASFVYDDEGRMTSISYPATSGTGPTYTYSFDALGRPSVRRG